MKKIKMAIPSKGRIAKEAIGLLSEAGFRDDSRVNDRALTATLSSDVEAIFVRASDIPEFVADGVADVGITGWDLVCESERELESLLDLGISRCRLVVAVVEGSNFNSVADIQNATVASSFPRLAKKYFSDLGKNVDIVPIAGSAEIAPHLGIADVIVDLVSTGSTLRTNGLRELGTIIDSSARLVATKDRVDEFSGLTSALESVIRARGSRYIMANVVRSSLDAVRALLPGVNGPTITNILGDDTRAAVHAVVDENKTHEVIEQLKALGAEGILVTRIERFV